MSIGRNDPCPCGSGKKYKKCCMKKEIVVEIGKVREERFFQRKHELTEEIQQFLERALSFSEQLRAEKEFEKALRTTKSGDVLGSLFSLWFLFFYRFHNGLRGVEWFYQERKASLSAEKRQMIETWVSLVPRLVQVVNVTEQGVIVQDRLNGEKLLMPFCETMHEAVPWGGTFCLIEPFGEGYYIHGAAIIEGPAGVERAHDKLRQLLVETKQPYEQIAFTHFLSIVDELMEKRDHDKREWTKIDKVTLHYEVHDVERLIRSLVSQDMAIVEEQKGTKTKLSFVGTPYMYEDNLFDGAVYMREVLGFIEISKHRLQFLSVLPDAVESFQHAIENMGEFVQFVTRTVEQLDAPKDVEFRSYAVHLDEDVPLYMGTVANQTVMIRQLLHRPLPVFDGKTAMEMAAQGNKDVLEQWLREREYVSFLNGKELECPVTVDFNTIRRQFGLPPSPFVTLGEIRHTRLRVIGSLLQRVGESVRYAQFDVPFEWMERFFGQDMMEFYQEKTSGKSEATVYKYRIGLSVVGSYLMQSNHSSWTSVTEEDWRECIVYHYLKEHSDASINQAKAFLSAAKALAKWIDARYGTDHYRVVRSMVQALEEDMYNAIHLLDLYTPYSTRKYYAWMKEIWRQANGAGRDHVDGTFQIVSILSTVMKLRCMEHGTEYTVPLPPTARAYAKKGMLIRGVLAGAGKNRWNFVDVTRVFPSKAERYMEMCVK